MQLLAVVWLGAGEQLDRSESSQKQRRCRRRNYWWAELMKGVLELDVLECDRCGGRVRILAVIHQPEAITRILECLGLLSKPPPISPAAPDREVSF